MHRVKTGYKAKENIDKHVYGYDEFQVHEDIVVSRGVG